MTEKPKKNPPKKLPVMRAKPAKPTKKKAVPKFQGGIFGIGVLLLIFGVLGLAYDIIQSYRVSAADILPSNTKYFVELAPEKTDSLSAVAKFPELLSHRLLETLVPAEIDQENYNWVGSKFGFGETEGGEFVLVRYRSKRRAREFLSQVLLLEGEAFVETKLDKATVYQPAYSNLASFAFYQNWLVIGSSQAALDQIIAPEQLLKGTNRFFRQNYLMGGKSWLRFFFHADALVDETEVTSNTSILKTLAKLMPQGVARVKKVDDTVEVFTKIQTQKDAFLSAERANKPVIPELAQFADKESFLFLNGRDLSQNYLHTQAFLESVHPQLALVFDGVFRAETQRIFGPKFDFSADFLSKMHGQYALILDYSDPLLPLPKLVLITGFDHSDTAQKLADFQETLRHAQGKFSTKVVEVELPDGSIREELVATDPREVVIEKNVAAKGEFYTVKNELSDAQIAYGFLQNYFVFSTDRTAVERIFAHDLVPLTQDNSFRDLVLFSDPAESYGVVDVPKLSSVKEKLATPDSKFSQLIDLIAEKYERVLFHRNAYSEYLDWNFVLE